MREFIRRFPDLFPEQRIIPNRHPLQYRAIMFLGLFGIFCGLGYLIPVDGFFAFDWVHFFGRGSIPPFYPPWTQHTVRLISYPVLVGLTLTSVGVASYERASHIISLSFTFFTLPLLWTIFLGQLDGLVVLGILGLPVLAPLVLLKPQVSIFSFLARRSYLVALLGTVAISFLIWGFWPQRMFTVWTVHEEGRYVNDIALGLLGAPVAMILLWFSRGDVDMLMLAGTFMTPYLLPYNLIVVVPSVARLSPRRAGIACVLSWLPFSANWLGPIGWYSGWLFIIWLWGNLAIKRYPEVTVGRWLQK